MYDKTLLNAEVEIISSFIPPGSTVCDAGCGEGEGTLAYSRIALVEAFDNCPERLEMANTRLMGNVALKLHDIRDPWLGKKYDVVISQRVLINLPSWDEQKKALANLFCIGKRVILCEGSKEGVEELNRFRALFSLPPIPVPQHNLFLDEQALMEYLPSLGRKCIARKTLGAYYLLTRGVQPALVEKFHWASQFNEAAASAGELLDADKFSRIKVWVLE